MLSCDVSVVVVKSVVVVRSLVVVRSEVVAGSASVEVELLGLSLTVESVGASEVELVVASDSVGSGEEMALAVIVDVELLGFGSTSVVQAPRRAAAALLAAIRMVTLHLFSILAFVADRARPVADSGAQSEE